jgi:hypothetical protein
VGQKSFLAKLRNTRLRNLEDTAVGGDAATAILSSYVSSALFFSGFEEIIYMSGSTIPLQNPEYLLETKEYRDTGVLFWPSYWYRGV